MLFNSNEISVLIAAVKAYEHSPLQVLKPELRKSLNASILGKLSSLSALTFFTKQEFTYMALAVDYVLDSPSDFGIPSSLNLQRLRDRLISLAEPRN